MRMADPSPFGETSFRIIVRAICDADPANVRDGGCVESVLTVLTQRRFGRFFAMTWPPVAASGRRGTEVYGDQVRARLMRDRMHAPWRPDRIHRGRAASPNRTEWHRTATDSPR